MPEPVSAELKGINFFGKPLPEEGSTDFLLAVQVFIGEAGDGRADGFLLMVCTPSKLGELYAVENWDVRPESSEALPGGNVRPVTGLWLMRHWSLKDLTEAIERLIPAYSPGPDFGAVAARIGRIAPWEFDYRYDDAVNADAGLPPLSTSFWHD